MSRFQKFHSPVQSFDGVFFFEGGGGGFHTELQDADTELLDLRVLHIYFYDNDDKVPFGFKSFVQFSP